MKGLELKPVTGFDPAEQLQFSLLPWHWWLTSSCVTFWVWTVNGSADGRSGSGVNLLSGVWLDISGSAIGEAEVETL